MPPKEGSSDRSVRVYVGLGEHGAVYVLPKFYKIA